MKLKKLSKITKKITDGSHFSPEIIDFGYPYVTVRDVDKAGIIDRMNCKKISLNDFEKLTLNGCKPNINDLLISKDGTIGKSAIVTDSDFVILSSLAILRFKKDFDVRYCYYWSISEHFMGQALDSLRGAALMRLTLGKISNFAIPFFDIKTQRKIVEFLDTHCSKIDNEVSLLQQKSILLDEYKNALIYETVTKGLDKNAEMKDSGIEWMGCVPIHWNIRRVKNILTNLNKSSFASGDADDGEYNFYVSGKKIKKISKFNLDKTAILLPTGGTFITHFNDNERCSYSTDVLALLLKNKNCNLKFYYYLFSSSESFFNEELFYGSGLKHLNRKGLFSTIVPVPLLKEQNNIVNYLDIETKKIEKEIELINKKVELLKEYKQSLIYEAVTGQLEIE